jgi:predicted Zn finger-like uncharacterized protein
MPSRIACPNCGAVTRLADDPVPGKKIRCRKCETLFPVPEDLDAVEDDLDEGERRPRRRRKQKSGAGALAVILIALLGGLLLLGGVAAAAFFVYTGIFSSGPEDHPVIKGQVANGPGQGGVQPLGGRGQPPPGPPDLNNPPPNRPRSQPRASGPEEGQEAPEISGEDIDGKAFKLSDYKGKVVLLDFWGNW